MGNREALRILNEDLELWARVLGHFERGTWWFNDALARVKALRIAIKAIKREEEFYGQGEE